MLGRDLNKHVDYPSSSQLQIARFRIEGRQSGFYFTSILLLCYLRKIARQTPRQANNLVITDLQQNFLAASAVASL